MTDDPHPQNPDPIPAPAAPPTRSRKSSKPLRLAGVLLVGLLLIGVVGAFFLLARVDEIVRRTVEREGTAQLDLATTLNNASISLFGGNARLDGLSIANPPGYSAPNLFELGQIDVGVGYRDLLGDPVRVRDVNIASPLLTIERGPEGFAQFNLRELIERLSTDETGDDTDEPTRLLINRLNVSNARVVVRPGVQGLREEYALTLPDVQLNDIGTADEAQNGAEIGRIATDVAVALARRAAESEELPPELRALLAGDIRQVAQQYAEAFRSRVGEEVGQQMDALEGRLRDTLGDDAASLLDRAREGDAAGAVEDAGARTRNRLEDEAGRRLGGLRDRLGGPRDPPPPPPPPPQD